MQIIMGVLTALFGQAAFVANAGSYLDLNLKQNRYLGEVQNSAQAADYTFLDADLDLEATSPRFNFKLNPIAQDSVGLNDEFYFGIPEAYVQPRRLAAGFDL